MLFICHDENASADCVPAILGAARYLQQYYAYLNWNLLTPFEFGPIKMLSVLDCLGKSIESSRSTVGHLFEPHRTCQALPLLSMITVTFSVSFNDIVYMCYLLSKFICGRVWNAVHLECVCGCFYFSICTAATVQYTLILPAINGNMVLIVLVLRPSVHKHKGRLKSRAYIQSYLMVWSFTRPSLRVWY